ncbi:hypothetical protein GSI_00547 [Ganoderma sinense ZZ0214-1]|uniref:Uncharacterized protein n=1 Tax=Ganoderma sinense ZZ0214-1 TaxID=1077348 RepID=A0A2G8SSV7_9APHY|nr:hypothetical protein GSI_00547 [Ganoderma sinense ZZ0214-1]
MFSLLWMPSTLLVLATVLVKVHSYVPALPSNQTDNSPTVLEGRLEIGCRSPKLFRVRIGVDLPLTVVLVSCDSNSTNPPHEDIFFRARDLKAVAGVLYSLYSETCVLTPGYNGTDANMPVYLSPSLNASRQVYLPIHAEVLQSIKLAAILVRAIEALFSKVDNRYNTWDSQTLQSEFYNISTDTPKEPNVDPGYLVAQAFWNASDAPASPSPNPSNKNGATAGAIEGYHALFR